MNSPYASEHSTYELLIPPKPFARRALTKVIRMAAGTIWRRRLFEFGRGAILERPAWITGAEGIAVEENVHIWRYARIEAFRTGRSTRRVRIGSGTKIQPFVQIAAAEQVTIGEGCLLASHVYITDHDHDYHDPDNPVVSNGRVVCAPVSIGNWAWLGQGVMVLKGVTIGPRCIVGAGSIVTSDLPAECIAVGSPARVIRKWDGDSRQWVRAKS